MFRFKMPARRPRRGTPKLSGLLFFNYFPGSTAMIKRMMMSALFLGAPLTLCAAPDSAPDGMMSLGAQAKDRSGAARGKSAKTGRGAHWHAGGLSIDQSRWPYYRLARTHRVGIGIQSF